MSNSNRLIQQELKMFSKYKTCKMLRESSPILTKQFFGKKKIVFFGNFKLKIFFPTRQIYVDMANDTDGQLTEDILLEKQYCSNASIDIYCNVTST